MDKLVKWLEDLIRAQKKSRAWRTFVSCLAAIVVFTTTYSLILPAITVESTATEDVGGLVMEGTDAGSTGAQAEAPGEAVTVDAENEVPEEPVQEEAPVVETAPADETSAEEPAAGETSESSSETGTAQPAASQTVQTAEEEVREPVNGEVQTIGDKRVMFLKGDDFDVAVSGDLSAGVSDRTVLSVRGIADADVVKSFSDRISDELLKIFVDKKTTEVLYQLVFTDENLVEYAPTGYFDVEFIFHRNTVSHTGEMIYAAIYDYLTDEMVLAEKNGDEYETPVISLDEYGIIKGITLKGMHFDEYSDIITLVAGPVNEELKLAAEKAAEATASESRAENTESADSKTEKTESADSTEKTESKEKTDSADKTESADAKTDSAESKAEGPSTKAETSKGSEAAESGTLTARGTDYTVTLSYGADAKIPAGASLEVSEIENGTRAYKKYLAQAKAAMGLDKDQELPKEQARFFDIKIMADGKEVQPSANVSVNITYDQPVVEAASNVEPQVDASAVHFGKKGAEVVAVNDVDASRVEFEAESFSVYGVIYTVDFEYTDPLSGQTFYYSIKGGSSILLSELLVSLGVKEYAEAMDYVANDVADVNFSNPSLVSVFRTGDDWVLESLQAFPTQETLTISLKDGSSICVMVTDDQTTGVWDLADPDVCMNLHARADSSVTETEQERDAAFRITISYDLTEETVLAIDAFEGNPVLEYDLSSLIENSPIEDIHASGIISVGTRRLGTYRTTDDGKVLLEFTDPSFFNGRTAFSGYFQLTAKTSETELGDQDEYTYEFPGTTDVIPIHYKKTVEDGKKTVSAKPDADGNYKLHYTATINVNSALDSMTFHDTLGGLQTLDPGSVKISGRPVTVSQSGQTFTFDVENALGTDGVAAGSYQVTYDTKVTADQLKAMEADKTRETNTVTWRVNGDRDVPGGETEIELDKPKEPIPVTKTISSTANQPGDVVNYTVTFGKDTTDLSGFHISDSITDVVVPQGEVTLSYNGEIIKIDFGTQAKDTSYSKNMVSLFDYTFPEGTPGFGPVTATYSVQLIDADTAKDNGVYDTTDVNNTAIEHRQNTQDSKKTTVTYEKEPHYEVDKTVVADPDTEKWGPGTRLSYTLTIGDADTNMAGVRIWDEMTDQQILQGDIMITLGNGQTMKLNEYSPGSVKWTDDGRYSDVRLPLFDFNMPSDAGNGPIVITYQTTVISQMQAEENVIYGEHKIENTGHAGKDSDSTSHTGVFGDYPIDKDVLQGGHDVNGQTVEMGSVLHYVLTFGNSTKNMGGVTILDEMTDLQKLSSPVTIRKADGTVFTMPTGSGSWGADGVVWTFLDDGKYSTGMVRVFNYKLPANIGYGPITVEYDTTVINENEANDNGIKDTQHVKNKFTVENHSSETDVTVEFPKDPKHNPQVIKEFDHWDVENSKVYWDIIVEKDSESAYPIENVRVRENDWGGIFITEKNVAGQTNYSVSDFSLFDVVNAVVRTEDGTILTPGVDYLIDKNNARFTFPVLNERVHILLAFNSPFKIVDGYYMKNTVRLENNNKTGVAEQTYEKPGITMVKNGTYTENDRLIKWEVQINSSKNEYPDSDPVYVGFEDQIPSGMVLVNYDTKDPGNPSVFVRCEGRYWLNQEVNVTVDPVTNSIQETDVAFHGFDGNVNNQAGLNKNKFIVTYYTLLSDEEWDRITSSASGSESFQNHVEVTAGDEDKFDATDTVTVTTEDYLEKTDTTKEVGGIVVDESGEPSKNITYTVKINPHGYNMNNDEPLTLTDYIDTNMDLDPASVEMFYMNEDESEGNSFEGAVISYNDDSRLLSIREIPDKTPLLLTYTCFARAQGQDTFKNTATLIGGGSHSSTITDNHNVQTNDAGIRVEGIQMNIHKIDENNIAKNLAGAKFQLYKCHLQIGDLINSEVYPQSYWDDLLEKMNRINAGEGTAEEIESIMEQFKIVSYEVIGEPKTTEELGFVDWASLNEHTLYAWREVESPENYTGNSDYHYFVGYQHINVNSDVVPQPLLPNNEQLNRKHAAWALDDACQMANSIRVASMANLTTWTATNVETVYTSVSATKEWDGDSDNLFETRPTDGIKLHLWQISQDGTKTEIGNPVSINADSEGNWPTYIWNRLPSNDGDGNPLKYTVTEERVDDYSTEYSDGGEGVTGGNITVTNKMIPKNTSIHVEKRFDTEGEDKPSEIAVTLKIIRTDKEGHSSDPEDYLEAVLNETSEWKYTFANLPTKEVGTDGKPYYLTYTVVEDTAALKRQGFYYTVSYSDGGEGVVEAPEDDPLVITNSKVKGSVKVTKTFSGVDSLPETFQITAAYTDADGTEQSVVLTTSTEGMTGTGMSDDPYTWTIGDLPLGTEVTFTETGITVDGYVVTANETARAKSCSATATAVENLAEDEEGRGTAAFVNEYVEDKGSLKIEKAVQYNGGEASGDDQKQKVNKTFSFTIKDLNGNPAKGKVNGTDIPETGIVSVSVTDGKSGSILITDMQPGKYTITENADTTGLTLTSITGGNNDPNLESRSITVEVKGGDAEAAQATAQVVFTNNYETTESTVIKNWDNKGKEIPTSIEMTLLVNGEDSYPKITKTLNAGNNWTATVTGLDKYLDGKEIVYSWREGGVPHYTVSSMTEEGTTVTFTNSYMTYDLKTSYVGKKSWVDQSNKFRTRPENLKVILQRKIASDSDWTSLELVPAWTNTETDEWTYTFSDIPVFDDDGNVYNYQAIEESPSGYIGRISSQTNTNYSMGSITYEDGHNRVTTDNKVIWTLSTTTDLAFVAIAPTAHGNCTVWSHRLPTPGEKAEIERILREGALPPATGRPIDYYSGTGSSIYTPHGNISIDFDEETGTVTMDFGKTKVWSQFIVGQFNTTAEQKYNPGSTSFTNELETTKLEGSKTWVIDGTTVPANPILTLIRTVTTTGDGAESTTSTPEVVKVMEGGTEVNLQPTWSGTGKTRTFEYTGLPKKDKDGNVYNYSVSEYKFTVGDVTYTVSKSDQGYVATPDPDHADTAPKFQVTQSDNAIFNTELKDFEVIKIWKDASDNNTGWIKNIKVFLHSKPESGAETTYEYEISQAADGSFNADSRTAGAPAASVSGNEKDGYTIKWSDLPAGNTYSATEEKVSGYKDPEYAKKVADGEIGIQLSIKDESGKDYTKAEDGMYIINRPEDAVSLPSTGGPGTRMFTVLGSILILGAGVLLWRRRRLI